jgi:site-specific recombinase XerD
MIAAGNDVPTVAAIMGHSGLRTIYRYVHPTAEQKKRAMERFEAAGNRQKLKVVG